MVGPLVGRRGLEVTLVEIGGQEREALGQPGVVVAAGKADPGLPVATERAERHRREAAVGLSTGSPSFSVAGIGVPTISAVSALRGNQPHPAGLAM